MRCTAKTQKEFTLTPSQFRHLASLGFKAIPATLSQAMGPNYRHLFFVSIDGTKRNRRRVHYYDVAMKPQDLFAIATKDRPNV